MIGQAHLYCRRDPQRLADPAEIVICDQKGNRIPVGCQLFAMPVRAPGVAAQVGPHRQIGPLDMVGRHLGQVGLSDLDGIPTGLLVLHHIVHCGAKRRLNHVLIRCKRIRHPTQRGHPAADRLTNLEEAIDNLKNMALAGEFCIQEAILTALAQQPADGLSVKQIGFALDLSGTGCEKMIESHLKHRLKQAGKVQATRGPNPSWMLTEKERARIRGGTVLSRQTTA